MESGKCVGTLERGEDVLRIVVGLEDREDSRSDEIKLGEELEHQDHASHGKSLSENAQGSAPLVLKLARPPA